MISSDICADTVPESKDRRIAILALACRMPGERNTPEDFWRGLQEGFQPVEPISAERRRMGLDDAAIPGGVKAAFVHDVDGFDAAFFGVSPREAVHMDPQHRLFLEVAAEALERAGLRWDSLAGSRTGVFLGISSNDYAWLPASSSDTIDVHTAIGAGPGMAPNRLSYLLDLRGPSLAVDTTCSSSLVATHLAVQSLRCGESDLAIVGGVNLMLSSEVMRSVAQAIPLAADARCKAYAANADGTIRGEGCVVFVLKRWQEALRDADPVHALILGSAVNQDGRSNGLTAPNPAAQSELISMALRDATVRPEQVVYLEGHGTGTQLGDQIELEAALSVFGVLDRPNGPCRIGSVKANVGHLEAAAGAAGLMRAALTLSQGVIAPHPLTGRPHPLLQKHPGSLLVDDRPCVLPTVPGVAVSVSAFSLGGTNAHLVLGKPPQIPQVDEPGLLPPAGRPFLLPICARSSDALARRIRELHEASHELEQRISLGALARTACQRQTRHPFRRTVAARTWAELRRELQYLQNPAGGNPKPCASSAARTRTVFVFPGHGSQWPEMARSLLTAEPIFRASIERLDAVVGSSAGWSLMALLNGTASCGSVSSSTFGQPALLAVQLALAELLESWGIHCAAVMGYSAGELPALVKAGLISEADAMLDCLRRARGFEDLASGGLLAARLGEREALREIRSFGNALALAAVTGPETTIISGDPATLEQLRQDLDRRDILCIDTGVSYLFHHPAARSRMHRPLAELELTGLSEPQLPFYSSVRGKRIRSASEFDARYWQSALCDTLRFDAAVGSAIDDGFVNFIEISPSPVLTTDMREILSKRAIPGKVVSTLRRFGESQYHLAMAVAALFDAGCPVEFAHFLNCDGAAVAAWPPHAWERQSFWWPAADTAEARPREPLAVAVSQPKSAALFQPHAYQMRWHEIPLPTDADPDQLRAVCAQALHVPSIARYAAIEPTVDALCGRYAAHALQQLGVRFEALSWVRPSDLEARIPAASNYGRFIRRLCGMLERDGYLQAAGLDWRVCQKPPEEPPDQALRELLHAHADLRAELQLLERCGPNIAGVIAGRINPLTLLFPDSDTDQAAALFGESGIAVAMNGIAAEVLKRELRRFAPHRPIRILEVGAGTGGTTAALRGVLAGRNVQYAYTDISRTLLRHGRRRFQDWNALHTQVLDIAREPAAQGFDLASFDIIVAANVLHATPDLRQSLRHLRRLLGPGGALLLIEATGPQRIIDLTFGLSKDWWNFRDLELRPDHPLLNAAQWLELLRQSDYEQVDASPDDPAIAGKLDMAVLCARARVGECAADDSSWLLIADESDIAQRLAQRLIERGHRSRVVPSAAAPRALAEARWQCIVDLRCLRVHSHEGWSSERILDTQVELAGGLIALVAQLAAVARCPRLVFISRGGTGPVRDGDSVDVVQAAFCASIAALAAEHQDWRPQVIDIDDDVAAVAAECIWSELQYGGAELRVAYRDGRRYRPTLRPLAAVEDGAGVPINAAANYAITGGLGAVGLETAEWLAARGARHLILAQRSVNPAAAALARIERLRAGGVAIRLVSVDLSNPGAAARFAEQLRRVSPPLKGVIHAAGCFDDALLVNQDMRRFERVLGPKVVGAWELHRGLLDLKLDLFLVFSSCAEILDPVGVANYVAANASLEALASRRRASGLSGSCIAWGGWSGLGMASRMNEVWERRWARRGVRALSPQEALSAMSTAVGQSRAVSYVMDVDWQRFKSGAGEQQRALLSELRPDEAAQLALPTTQLSGCPLQSLRESSRAERLTVLENLIRSCALEILQLPPRFAVDPDLPFADMGFDSLMSLELRDALAAKLQLPLPATLLFDHPTLTSLLAALLPRLSQDAEDGSAEGPEGYDRQAAH